MTENNTALITGEICSPPVMSHSFKGENFYTLTVKVKRLSDVYDYITVTVQENMIQVETLGYGHRVGLSQYGADAMAAAGSDYQQILSHYYPGTVLEKCLQEGG